MRYIRLIRTFIRVGFQNESAYRFNFLMKILSVSLNLAGSIGGIYIIYANNESLNGWAISETLAVLGVYMLIQAIRELFLNPSLDKLGGMGGEIEMGTFDYTLLKPISKQFYISTREWSLWSLLDIAVSLGIIVLAVRGMQAEITVASVAVFLFALLISIGILYSIMLFLNSIAFWYRGTYLLWIMNDVMQAGRYPISIYPPSVRLVLTWVFPIGFIVSVPAESLMNKAEPVMLIAGFLFMVILFISATVFFNISLRKYSSASS